MTKFSNNSRTMADEAAKTEVAAEKPTTESEPKADAKGDAEAKAAPAESEEKSEAKTENGTLSDLEQKIIRQVEYYFGDYNLPKDKFLQEEIKKEDGWVSLDTMLNFQRLKNLTTDKDVISAALLKSTANLLEVSEDKSKLRRNPEKPLPELSDARRQEIIGRSVYIKGFPQDSTLDKLLEFLKAFGKTDNVQMRNWHDKVEDKWNFKGSIFVTFPTKDEAEAFIKLESVKHGETELIRKWQGDYIEEKKLELKEGRRGKEKRKQNLKEAAGGDKKSEENGGDKEDKETEKEKVEHVLGAVLVLKGLKETTKWTGIKDRLVELGGAVAFVDFSPGDPEAYARLKEAGSAKEVFAKMEGGKVEIDGTEVEVRVLEGDEEVKYLDDQQEARKNKRNQFKRKGSQRGRGRGRGGKRGRF